MERSVIRDPPRRAAMPVGVATHCQIPIQAHGCAGSGVPITLRSIRATGPRFQCHQGLRSWTPVEEREVDSGFRDVKIQDLSVLPKRQPTLPISTEYLTRQAARRKPGTLIHAPPRTTRPLPSLPEVQADPSIGAPL